MSENTLQWIQFIKLLILAGYATLYGFGGVSGKWKRRYIAPFILTAAFMGVSVWMSTFSLWYALYFPLLSLALHIGYGGTTLGEKVKKRSLAGLALGVAAAPLAIVTASWLLWVFHIILCVFTSVVLGVWNPTKSARAEETMIGFISGFLPFMGMI